VDPLQQHLMCMSPRPPDCDQKQRGQESWKDAKGNFNMLQLTNGDSFSLRAAAILLKSPSATPLSDLLTVGGANARTATDGAAPVDSIDSTMTMFWPVHDSLVETSETRDRSGLLVEVAFCGNSYFEARS
jgi:hypothetical protein